MIKSEARINFAVTTGSTSRLNEKSNIIKHRLIEDDLYNHGSL